MAATNSITTVKMETFTSVQSRAISILASSRKRSSVPSPLRASAHQCPRLFAQALISALASSRKRSSVVVPLRERPVEQELCRRRRVELQLGVRLVGNIGVVGDQERRLVPGPAQLLARNVRQATA